MKKSILKLRDEGKSYNEIKKIIGCSKSTISYYCGIRQKEKTNIRTKKRRENILVSKLERFKYRKVRTIKEQIRKFNKRDNLSKDSVDKNITTTFNIDDVINKFGMETTCYLTGEKISLCVDNFQLDHIVPSSRGGDNSLENMGITHSIANQMKNSLLVNELIEWCVKILNHNGYIVTKI